MTRATLLKLLRLDGTQVVQGYVLLKVRKISTKMNAFCHDKKLITALLNVQILRLSLLRNP